MLQTDLHQLGKVLVCEGNTDLLTGSKTALKVALQTRC